MNFRDSDWLDNLELYGNNLETCKVCHGPSFSRSLYLENLAVNQGKRNTILIELRRPIEFGYESRESRTRFHISFWHKLKSLSISFVTGNRKRSIVQLVSRVYF